MISVLVIGGTLASFFLLPAAHRLSLTLGIGAVSVLSVALFLKVTLWIIPWIVGTLCVLGTLALIYELYYRFKYGTFDKPGDGKGNI